MSDLSSSLQNLRKVILKNHKYYEAIKSRSFSNDAEKAACTEVSDAYNKCFYIISGGKSRAPISDLKPLNAARAEYLREVRKLNNAFMKLSGVQTPGEKAAATRKANKLRNIEIQSQVVTYTKLDGEEIVKTGWESGYDQDYSHTVVFTPTAVTLNGVTYEGYHSRFGWFKRDEVQSEKVINLHRGLSRLELKERSYHGITL